MKSVVLLIVGALVGCLAAQISAHRRPTEYFFGIKVFSITNDAVYVVGTLTGDGIPHKFNTAQISCYKDRMICATNDIRGISEDTCQLSRLDSPLEIPITKWDDFEIVASDEASTINCIKTTISLDLKGQRALWVEEPSKPNSATCGTNNKTYRWTIEEPQWSHAAQKG